MKTLARIASVALVAGFGMAATTAPAPAQPAFPEREVVLVVPWAPGGRTDIAARLWAPVLGEVLGVPVVVDNRVGGGGVVGARSLLQNTDGHHIGMFSITHLISEWTRIPPFELGNYRPIALPYSSPFVIAVQASSPYQTLADFVAAAEAGRLSIGDSGSGTSGHIASAAFALAAGITIRHVPYEGDAGAVAALLGGEVQGVLAPMVSLSSQIAAGELRPLAVSLAERNELHEGIPTFVESGVDFTLSDLGGGLYLPGGASPEYVALWEAALAETFANEDLQARMAAASLNVNFVGTEEFEAELAAWTPILEELVTTLGLRLSN